MQQSALAEKITVNVETKESVGNMMDMDLGNRFEYIYDNGGKLLLINGKESIRTDGSAAIKCIGPATFNRTCGHLLSATADPGDHAFKADISVSSALLSVDATFGRQMRHGAGPQDLRSPAVLLLMRREGEALLRVGSSAFPLDIAIVGSDVDFTIKAAEADTPCSVTWIALMGMPDLVARMPRPLIVPKTLVPEAQNGRREALRTFGGRVVNWLEDNSGMGETEIDRLTAQLSQLVREQFEFGEWEERGFASRDIIASVQRYLRQNAHDADVTPSRLARHCAVSVRKLYNAFADADMSLRATVLSYRLEEARRQLNSREIKKVTSIAYDAGFKDVSTFYRNFRREFGYSPRSMPASPMDNNTRARRRSSAMLDDRLEVVSSPRETLFRKRTSRHRGLHAGAPAQVLSDQHG